MMNTLFIRLASFTLRKALIFGLIAGGIYYFMAFDDGSSIRADIDKVQKDIQEQEAKSKEAEAALKEVEQVRAAVGALSDQFKMVAQAIPTDVNMADIIRAVDTVARAAGIAVKSKEPRDPVNYEYYEEIPIKVTLEGSFSQITMFLYYIASLERIMKVKTFSISYPSSANLSGGAPSNKLVFDGVVMSYRFLGEPKKVEPVQR